MKMKLDVSHHLNRYELPEWESSQGAKKIGSTSAMTEE